MTCWICGKTGHKASDCRSKGKGKGQKSGKGKGQKSHGPRHTYFRLCLHYLVVFDR